MAGGGGTTNAGAFRFPYQFIDIVTEIRDKLDKAGMSDEWDAVIDNFMALYMDRDRALEDYTTAAARTSFTTVAGDGTGDYTTIKAAIEAQTAGTTNGGWNVIYVKPQSGGYPETALGAVTFPSGARIQLWAGGAINPIHFDLLSSHTMLWQCGQWIKTGSPNIALKGFFLATSGAVTLISNSSSGLGGSLSMESCQFACPLYTTTTSKNFSHFYLDNCSGTLNGGTWTESLTWEIANGSHQVSNITSAFSFTNAGGPGGTWSRITFRDCDVSAGAGVAWTGGYDTSGTGRARSLVEFKDCSFMQPFGGPTWALTRVDAIIQGCAMDYLENSNDHGWTWNFIDVGMGRNSNQVPTDEYGTFIVSENNMQGHTLNFSYSTPPGFPTDRRATVITGTYGKLSIGVDSVVVLVGMGGRNNSCPIIDVSGNKNIIFATMNRHSQMGDGTPLTVSGDNNQILYTSANYSGTHTDLGSGNIINGSASFLLGMNLADAAGDLLVADGPNNFVRFPIGSDGQMLTVDTSVSTQVAWEDPAHFIYDAKGDLLVATGDNTYARVAVGQDQRLIRASSGDYTGVSWDYQRTLNNRLTQNQASLETDTTGWTAESGCTIARNAANASHGSACLEITKS